jgi:hypothetical protein
MRTFLIFLASVLAWMEHTEAHGGSGVGLFVFYFGIIQKKSVPGTFMPPYCDVFACIIIHNTEPRILPYKLAAIVHAPSNVVGLATQKLRFPISWIKPHLMAPKNCRPHRPVRSYPAVIKSEKDAKKLQYFL